jgi:hypothetical protein
MILDLDHTLGWGRCSAGASKGTSGRAWWTDAWSSFARRGGA